jgi:hypothetical protein
MRSQVKHIDALSEMLFYKHDHHARLSLIGQNVKID